MHHEKRVLASFLLTVGKDGQKLTPSQAKIALGGGSFTRMPGGVEMEFDNGTMDDFCGYLQSAIVNRPVVNRTGIAGRFNIRVKFMPDGTQFNGHPPFIRPGPDTTDIAPDLLDAMQRQLGLKLSSEKTDVDVVVIDHVEKPSAN
jgi:uncharacterized protein (TIGR03435 family)